MLPASNCVTRCAEQFSLAVLIALAMTACQPHPPGATMTVEPGVTEVVVTPTQLGAIVKAPAGSASAVASSTSQASAAFVECLDITPGIPACSGKEPLARGWIAFVAQRAQGELPDVARVVQLDGAGAWSPEMEGRPDSPLWSPSGAYLIWHQWRRGDTFQDPWVEDRSNIFDRAGLRIRAAEHENLDYPSYSPGFLTSAQTPDGRAAALAYDATSAVAVSLPDGQRRRLPVRFSERETDWGMGEAGQLAVLQFRRLKYPDQPQYLQVWRHWWDGRSTNLALVDSSPEPDLQLNAISPSARWLLAARGIHILANTNWRNPDFVRIDAETGSVHPLSIRSSEFGGILWVRGAHGRPWRPGGRDELLLVGQQVDPAADSAIGPHVEISRLALLDLAHPQLRWLTDERLRVTAPAWSPDGGRIVFAAQDAERALPEGWPQLGRKEEYDARRGLALYLLDLETGEQRRLTEPGEAWDSGPEWSADGSRVLYMRGFDPDINPETGTPAGLSRYQVRVLILDEARDELLLDHVGSDWAWSGGASEPR